MRSCSRSSRASAWTWEDLRVKHLKDVFFSKGVRPALFFAQGLTQQADPDDLYPGRMKLNLGFELPKGAYATLVVKRVTDAASAILRDDAGTGNPRRGGQDRRDSAGWRGPRTPCGTRA